MSRALLPLALTTSSEAERQALYGALLAAVASERTDRDRWAQRTSLGYGSDGSRAAWDQDIERHKLRLGMLERLLAAYELAWASTYPAEHRLAG